MTRRAWLAAMIAAVACVPGRATAEQEQTVQWNERWPRVRVVEMLDVVALTAGSVLIDQAPSHAEAQWKGPILWDKPVRELMRSTSRVGQKRAAQISDALYKGMVLAPYVVDDYFVALGIHQNADVALQLTLMDMQSLGLSGVLTLAAEHAVGRQRPYVAGCRGRNEVDEVGFNQCGGADDFKSFYSGHAAAMFTMAGLTCVHHEHLPLYGGGAPDALICAVMIGLAISGSAARVVTDRHWSTDVALGAAVGVFNGYLLPRWLHYGLGGNRPAPRTTFETALGTIVPLPQIYDDGAGLGFAIF